MPAPNDIPAEEVQAYFDAHKRRLPRPRAPARLGHRPLDQAAAAARVSRQAAKATPGAVGRARAQANRSIRTRPGQGQRARSTSPGDLGFVSPPGDPRGANARVPEEVRAAVFEVGNVGDVLPRVVPAAGKFYVVKLESKTDATTARCRTPSGASA